MTTTKHRARSLLLATCAVATSFYGCASVLGIADDVNRAGSEGGITIGPDGETLVDGELPDTLLPDDTGGGDGGGMKDARVDADAIAPVTCDLAKDFAAPVAIPSIDTVNNEGSARFTENELTIFFDSDRGGAKFDLYTATRPSLAGAFSTPVPIAGAVDTVVDEYSPSVTTDGLTIFFERQDATGVSRLFSAPRAAMMFGVGTALANVNSNSYTANPFARGNAAEIYYVSDTGLLTPINIYRAKRQGDGTYVGATIANINVNDVNVEPIGPVVSADGLTLYFSSDKAVAGFKGQNVYVAKRASLITEFGVPALVPNVNGDNNEQPTWISSDGCRLYLASNRNTANKGDVFVATRPK